MTPSDDLQRLVERIEGATGPSFVLDCAIGQVLRPDRESWPAYTTSLDVALSLVPTGWIVEIRRYFNSDGEYVAAVDLTDSGTVGRGCHPEEELTVQSRIVERRQGVDPTPSAITAASLRARITQEQSNG